MRRHLLHTTLPIFTLALAGCTGSTLDLYAPDWQPIAVERGDRDPIQQSSIPTPTAGQPVEELDINADGILSLSLEQTVLTALSRNRDLQVAQLTPVETGAFELIERGAFDPEIFAEASIGKEESIEVARSTGDQFPVDADTSSIEAGISASTPTGTNLELAVTQERDISNRSPEQQTARAGLTITQSLLRGLRPSVNLAAVRQAELETDASLYELRGLVEALVAETETAYWRYALAKRRIDIFERSLEVARKQSNEIDQRIEFGDLAPAEAAAARSEVALREQGLIDARASLEAERLRLLRLVDAPLSVQDVLTTGLDEISQDLPPDLDDTNSRVELALKARPELNEARLRLEQNRLETIRTRDGLLPRLELFATLGKTGYDDTFAGSFEELDGDTYDFTLGIRFAQALGRTEARGRDTLALASRDKAALAVSNLEQLVELEVLLADNEVRRARDQIRASRTTRQLQEQTAQAEEERFRVGASTTLLVAQAQRDLLDAQIAEVEAIIAYRLALIQAHLAEGTLLERRRITLDSASETQSPQEQ